jgi:AraC-like DNA-binding protein
MERRYARATTTPRRAADGSSRWRIESERWNWPRRTRRPHPALGQLLARDYWGITTATGPHRLLIPASASVTLVLKIDDSPHRPPAFLHGSHDRFDVMEGDCAPSYLEIVMSPLGAYQLLGRPTSDLGTGIVDLEAAYGADGGRFLAEVRDRGTWPARFAVVDAFLLRAARRGLCPSPEVQRAWQLLRASGGRIAIRDIVADIGWSHKHLIAKFTQQVGLPPKAVARLTRFERVLARTRTGPVGSWSRVAAECGYADQSHLIREFREFAGTTPVGYLDQTAA